MVLSSVALAQETTALGKGKTGIAEQPYAQQVPTPQNRQPAATLTVRRGSSKIANRYQFDATLVPQSAGPGQPSLQFHWEFGDGTSLAGVNLSTVRHTFPPGEFATVVSIEDPSGRVVNATARVGGDTGLKNAGRLPLALNVLPSTVEAPVVGAPEKSPNSTPDKSPISAPHKPPIATPDKSPTSAPDKPPIATTDKPPIATPDRSPTSAPDKPPIATTDKPPIATTDKPPIATTDKPPIATPDKPPIATPDKPPIATPDKSLIKPAVPVNLSPATDESLGVGATVPFIWGATSGASRYDFRIIDAAAVEVVRVGEFAASEICSGNRCRLTQGIALEARQHYRWQVRAGHKTGWSSWSTTEVYVVPVGVKVPRIPLALFPTAGDLLARGETTRFLWTHREGVEGYQFQLISTQTKEALHSVRVNALKACNPTQCAFPRKISLPASEDYAWQIRATNAAGESGWYRTAIKVANGASGEPPVASFTHVVSKADALAVRFDASGSSDDQSVVRYAWSFGEQNNEDIVVGEGPVVEHRFAEGGSYIAVLTVTDEAGLTASTFGQVDVGLGTAPQAHFTVSDFSGGVLRAPVLLTFDPASSSGDSPLTQYAWDFADGTEPITNSNAAVVSHVFSSAGEFTVRLRVTNELNLSDMYEKSITVANSIQGLSVSEAGRFLAQSTFGANRQTLDRLRELGIDDWLFDQFDLRSSRHLDYVRQHALRDDISTWYEIWWSNAVHGSDQLRQRVALALSQIFTVPHDMLGIEGAPFAVAAWYDLLLDHAFGNYRDLLEAITLSPVMGLSRGHLQNAAADSTAFRSLGNSAASSIQIDEGYARSLLKQFTLGDVKLEADGTTTRKPAFDSSAVSHFARALTGWNLAGATEWSLDDNTSQLDWVSPMIARDEYHDKGAKALLDGELLPPGLTAEQDLRLALDNLFADANVGPFVAGALIRQLVTDNPAPAYIERVARVFADNGQGVRGDLRAVIRSILTDKEARVMPNAGAPGASSFGKLRTPLLRLAHLWRAFSVQPGSTNIGGELQSAGAQSQQLVLPQDASELLSAGSLLNTTSEITEQIHRYNNDTGNSDDLQFAHLDLGPELALANRPSVLLRHLDTVLLSGNMNEDLYAHLLEHLERLPNTAAGQSTRVRDAISLILASPDYLVQM